MTRKTKKIGRVARFGPRYGVKAKRQVQELEQVLHSKHVCPQCASDSVKRVSSGIWHCRHCDLKFAGGAYQPIRQVKTVELVGDKPRESRAGFN